MEGILRKALFLMFIISSHAFSIDNSNYVSKYYPRNENPEKLRDFSYHIDLSFENSYIDENDKILIIPTESVSVIKSTCFLAGLVGLKYSEIDFPKLIEEELKQTYNTENWFWISDKDIDFNTKKKMKRMSEEITIPHLSDKHSYIKSPIYDNLPVIKDLVPIFKKINERHNCQYAMYIETSIGNFEYQNIAFFNTNAMAFNTAYNKAIEIPVVQIFIFECTTGKLIFNSKHFIDGNKEKKTYKHRNEIAEDAVKKIRKLVKKKIEPQKGGFFGE